MYFLLSELIFFQVAWPRQPPTDPTPCRCSPHGIHAHHELSHLGPGAPRGPGPRLSPLHNVLRLGSCRLGRMRSWNITFTTNFHIWGQGPPGAPGPTPPNPGSPQRCSNYSPKSWLSATLFKLNLRPLFFQVDASPYLKKISTSVLFY